MKAVGWLVVLRINVDLAIFQPHLDLEAGDNQSLNIQVVRPGIEPWSSCSASREVNHSATAIPFMKAYRNLKKSCELTQPDKSPTRGPRAFYRSPDNQKQTVQSEKKTTRMAGFQ